MNHKYLKAVWIFSQAFWTFCSCRVWLQYRWEDEYKHTSACSALHCCVPTLKTNHWQRVSSTSRSFTPLNPPDCRRSYPEGSRADVASQRPGQLGSEDVVRVAAQTSGPKHRQGRGGPEAERPQVLQRSDNNNGGSQGGGAVALRSRPPVCFLRVWAAAVVARLAHPPGVERHRPQPGVSLRHQHRVLRRAALRQLPDAAAGNLVTIHTVSARFPNTMSPSSTALWMSSALLPRITGHKVSYISQYEWTNTGKYCKLYS